MLTKEQIQAEHPDWTPEQVDTEHARLKAEHEKDPPDPKPDDRDAGMARLRREKEAAERKARDAQAELDRRDREQAEQAGEWEKLAKQYETERDQARTELTELRQEIKVKGFAKRLKFRHEDEAIALLPRDVDVTDEGAVQAALEALAENRPHLIDNGKPGPTGLPPSSRSTDLTIDQIKAMTPQEYLARKDEVDKAVTQLS